MCGLSWTPSFEQLRTWPFACAAAFLRAVARLSSSVRQLTASHPILRRNMTHLWKILDPRNPEPPASTVPLRMVSTNQLFYTLTNTSHGSGWHGPKRKTTFLDKRELSMEPCDAFVRGYCEIQRFERRDRPLHQKVVRHKLSNDLQLQFS